MLQYIINASSIWFVSLVLFDVFLKKESYHSYNRCYLLLTFLLGIFLPLWQWGDNSLLYRSGYSRPEESIASIKQNIVDTATTASDLAWTKWVEYIYIAGAGIFLAVLIIEMIKIISLYSKGVKTKEENYTIVETGRGHAPFSVFNKVFIKGKQNYNSKEWYMLLSHEQQHARLVHFADVLLMQFARIVFWFHPLIYIYNKRLLMVHEYQADTISKQNSSAFGKFLIEQSLLQSAPTLSHSFSRSPIKNRIMMLTKKSTTIAKTKLLVFLPLLLVCLFCFTENSFSYKFDKKGNVITFKGNKFEMTSPSAADTAYLVDPVTGKTEMKVFRKNPYPIKMNDKKIYRGSDDVKKLPEMPGKDEDLYNQLLRSVAEQLEQLPNGQYTLDLFSIVVNSNGKIVFYEYNGISRSGKNNDTSIPDIKTKLTDISKQLEKNLNNMPALKPAEYNGKKVIYDWTELGFKSFSVTNHKLIL